jgi:kinesin family protein 20
MVLAIVEKRESCSGLLWSIEYPTHSSRYTIQGGNEQVIEERGVLPRAIDVVFNSIAGLESKANVSYHPFHR